MRYTLKIPVELILATDVALTHQNAGKCENTRAPERLRSHTSGPAISIDLNGTESMHIHKATCVSLLVLAGSMAGDRVLRAAPMCGRRTPHREVFDDFVGVNPSGGFIDGSVPVGAGDLRLEYLPSPGDRIVMVSGDATFFRTYATSYFFELSVAPGFRAQPNQDDNWNVEIIAPPPGGGLDAMIFTGFENTHNPGFGSFEIFAPNGTLSTTSELPSNLDAFEDYGRNHLGGTFEFLPGNGVTFPYYSGDFVTGVLWVAPEPPSIVSMTIGMSLPLCLVALRRWRRMRMRHDRLGAVGCENGG